MKCAISCIKLHEEERKERKKQQEKKEEIREKKNIINQKIGSTP